MSEQNPRALKRWVLLIGGVLAILAVAVATAFLKLTHGFDEKGMQDAAYGVGFLAEKLHERSLSGELPRDIAVDDAAETDGRYRFSGGHFDMYEYSIAVVGEYPEYAGTVITYHGREDQAPVTLTVNDLAAKDWMVEREPIPEWWEIWK